MCLPISVQDNTFLDVLPEHFGLKTNQDITMVCSDQNKTVCQAMQRQYSLSLQRLGIINRLEL